MVVKFPSAVDLLFSAPIVTSVKKCQHCNLGEMFFKEFATVTFYDDQTSYIGEYFY